MKALEALRKEIDQLDQELLQLITKRAECALRIGDVKREAQIAVYAANREQELLDRLCQQNAGPLSEAAIQAIFQAIIKEVRQLQEDYVRSSP